MWKTVHTLLIYDYNQHNSSKQVVDKILKVSKVEAPIDYKKELEKEKKRTDNHERRLNALEKPKPGRKKASSEPKKTVESKNDDLEQVLDVLENRNKEKRESKPLSNE